MPPLGPRLDSSGPMAIFPSPHKDSQGVPSALQAGHSMRDRHSMSLSPEALDDRCMGTNNQSPRTNDRSTGECEFYIEGYIRPTPQCIVYTGPVPQSKARWDKFMNVLVLDHSRSYPGSSPIHDMLYRDVLPYAEAPYIADKWTIFSSHLENLTSPGKDSGFKSFSYCSTGQVLCEGEDC
jgi:hypothetical protein